MFIPDGVANNPLSLGIAFPCKNPDLIYQKTKVVEHTLLLHLQTYSYIFLSQYFSLEKSQSTNIAFYCSLDGVRAKVAGVPSSYTRWWLGGFAILFLRKISSRYFQKGFSQPLFGRTSKIDDTRRDENTIFCIKFLPN